jgi:hypothetical protein
MLTAMIQSLIGPRYPRRYVGRHRARLIVLSISTAIANKAKPSD